MQLITIFCGFRKVRFHCYSRQFKWNQVVIVFKRSGRLLLASLKLSFKNLLFKRQKLGLIYWSKMLLITIFRSFRKLPFQCYSRQLKWNQVVIVLKRSRRLLLSFLKLSFKYLFFKYQE